MGMTDRLDPVDEVALGHASLGNTGREDVPFVPLASVECQRLDRADALDRLRQHGAAVRFCLFYSTTATPQSW